ncbi:MAG: hypothetical protein ACXACX_15390 [Candidatus Hodarchaeales archaeon]|jgi:hypothetical protein
MAEIAIALLTPIASFAGKWLSKKLKQKLKKKTDQESIKINVKSPNYNGTANHWVSNLYEQIAKNKEEDLKYAYVGESLGTSIEIDSDVSTIKMKIPNVDQDAMKELMDGKLWNNENDRIHGNGVFSFSLPQIVLADHEEDSIDIRFQDLSSTPLNGKYMFSTKLQITSFEKQDPGDFYKHGGTFEIPVYLEKPQIEYHVYPITPPPPNIPEYAIRTNVVMEREPKIEEINPIFVFCPYCGTKMPKKKTLKYCVTCGKNIEDHLNF